MVLVFFILKAELKLDDKAVALGLLPGVLGCALGYHLSKMVSGTPRRGFILSYSLLCLGLVPLVTMPLGVVSIGATVFIVSMSNIIHSFVLSEVRLSSIPRAIEGRVNSWLTVVIRIGNLFALTLAPSIYKDWPLTHIHCVFAAVLALIVLASFFLYTESALARDLNQTVFRFQGKGS